MGSVDRTKTGGVARRVTGLPISTVLAAGFCLLTLLALALVLVVSYDVARRNTSELVRDKSELVMHSMRERVRAHVEPVRAQLDYLAGYLARYQERCAEPTILFVPLAMIGSVCALLIMEPDLGSAVVILCAGVGVLFLAGAKLRYFLLIGLAGAALLALLIYITPWRMERLVAFLDPWSVAFGSGYQLTQALIEHGASPHTPCAVVENGGTPLAHTVCAPLAEIASAAVGLRGPALVIVGDVVNIRRELGRAPGGLKALVEVAAAA